MKNEYYSAGAGEGSAGDISITDMIHYYSSWTWRAVEALVQSKDFQSDMKWIANRLNISAEAARDAVEGLLRIGVIKEVESGLSGNSEFQYTGSESLERADLFHIHDKIRSHLNDKLTSRDCFANGYFLTNKQHVAEFYAKFSKIVEELHTNSLKDKSCTEVYGLELSVARITR